MKRKKISKKNTGTWYRTKIIVRLSAFCIAFMMLMSFTLQTCKAVGDDVIRTQGEIEDAATAMLAANALKKCVSAHMRTSGGTAAATSVNDMFTSDWTDIGVGVWLESKTQGKVQNGSIYCDQGDGTGSDSLVGVFAKELGISTSLVQCNNGAPGIVAAATASYNDHGNYTRTTYTAKDSDCGNASYYVKNPNADSYLSQLWNTYKKDSWPSWDKVNDYTDPNATGMYAYFMYRKEYDTFCTKNESLGFTDTNSYDSSFGSYSHTDGIMIIDKYGGTKYRWDTASTGGSIRYGFAAGENGATCTTLVSKINEFAPYYRDYIKNLIKEGCKSGMEADVAAKREEAQALIDDPDSSDEQKRLAEEKITEIDEAISNGYVVDTKYGGYDCVEIDGVKKVTVEDSGSLTDDNPSGGFTPSTGGGTTHTPTPEDEQKEACFHEAGSLGWIVCPMIFGMDEFIQGIYEKHIEPLLKPDKAIIANLSDSSSALHTSWGYFRDFANVIFVGVLLIIIFSQVTGFGIDNFGIKRMLPKLIIAAVLVNLSFIICALVIDASNIAGRGIYNLMTTLGDSITPPDTLGASGTTGSYAAVIIEVLIIGLTGAGAAAAIASQGWLIILPILLLALSIVISVIFLFITLGVRQAAIIVFIILAPLGLVMYILPNTHSLFKKWVSIFSALLLVYPIASLLIGAGYFVARMLLFSGSDNIMMYLVAGLVSVAPYFFIPSIVSNSMKGLGNIGAKLQGLGKSVSGSTTRAINQGVRGSQRYQNAANRRLNARQASFQNSQLKKYAKRKSGIRGYLPGGRVRDEFGHYEMDEAKIDALGMRPTSGLFKNARANANAAKLRDIATASAAIAGNDVGLARSKASMAMSNLRPEALRGAEADYAEAETQKMIKAQESLIESTMKSANLDENAIGNQLESALQDAATDPNRLAAYANVLNKTKEGQRVLRRVLRETSMNGTMAGNNQQAIARHIVSNPGNLKEKDPDTLKWAAEAQHTQSHVDYGGFLHGSTGDLSNDAFKNLDSQVLASYANNAEALRNAPTSSLSAEQRVQLNQSTNAARMGLQSYFAGTDNFEQDRLDHMVRMAGFSNIDEARSRLDGTTITPDGNGGFKIQHGGGQTS